MLQMCEKGNVLNVRETK